MKKRIILVFVSLLFLIMSGCSKTSATTATTSPSELKLITDLSIINGIVSFSEVEGATKYVLRIKQDGELVENREVSNNMDIKVGLSEGKYSGEIKYSLANRTSEYSSPIEFIIGDYTIETMNEIKGEDLKNPKYINFNGRVNYVADDLVSNKKDMMYFYYTASGFKLSFNGTELKATFYATGSSSTTSCAYLVILVDGDTYPSENALTLALNKGEVAEYTLVEGLSAGVHSIEVLKRSEASDNTTALKSVKTDGHFMTPPEDREMNILLLGASGSAGYGNLAKSTTAAKNTYNSDGLKAFPYLTARMFNADLTCINASGWGLKWGWNSQAGNDNIPRAFEKLGINNSNKIVETDYDVMKDDYDVIIINLGMNDFSYLNGNIAGQLTSIEKENKILLYEEAVKALYIRLHTLYQEAIIITVTTSESDNNQEGLHNKAQIEEAMKEFPGADPFIYSVVIPKNGAGVPYGANSHANVQTHILSANLIMSKIVECTDFKKVIPNITFLASRDTVN